MPAPTSTSTKSGIQTSTDGTSYIPSSRRADGSTRKEIRVRPGYRPPEDVETYKNHSVQAWKNRGRGGVPGAESFTDPTNSVSDIPKSKNAKRREAAKKNTKPSGVTGVDDGGDDELPAAMEQHSLSAEKATVENWRNPSNLSTNITAAEAEEDAERQKKIRNLLKKLKAVRELKGKKDIGEKLSPDQLAKLLKESELVRDLQKIGYKGQELEDGSGFNPTSAAER